MISFSLSPIVYDASVKTPAGIEYGSVYQFGNFDQCMGVRTDFQVDRVNIEPKYCLIDVNTTDYHVRRLASRKHVVSIQIRFHVYRELIVVGIIYMPFTLTLPILFDIRLHSLTKNYNFLLNGNRPTQYVQP